MIDWSTVVDTYGVTLLDSLKLFVGITDTAQDAELTRALNAAGPAVESYLDRVIASREVIQQFPGYFGTVMLHNAPVTGTPAVTLNGVSNTSYSVYHSGTMAYLTRTGQPRDAPIDWRQFDQVDVTYTAGWIELPSDMATAIVYVASGLFASEGTGVSPSGGGDVSRMSINDVGSISYATGADTGLAPWGVIPSTAAEMLSRYRRVSA